MKKCVKNECDERNEAIRYCSLVTFNNSIERNLYMDPNDQRLHNQVLN